MRPYLGGALVKSFLVLGGRARVVDAVADVARGEVGARRPHAAHILAHHLLGVGAAVDRVDRRDDGRTARLGLGAWWWVLRISEKY